MQNISIFWFRRDLRLEDNTALNQALLSGEQILPLFIFDDQIINELPVDDPRVNFIYESLSKVNEQLSFKNTSILCLRGNPIQVWEDLIASYSIKSVFVNKDYEPYARDRDQAVEKLLRANTIDLLAFKDQVIHQENDVLKKDGTPYTVYTPYKNKWIENYQHKKPVALVSNSNFFQNLIPFASLQELGIEKSKIKVQDYNLSQIYKYPEERDFPGVDSTSYLSPHLRFGTVSVRTIISKLTKNDKVFMSELIWREFFMQILFHFPKVVSGNFRSKYDGIEWLNNPEDFKHWCNGTTGYPMVDAGMRQLNKTGYMHNRVRMVTAGFLCKHLLIDWRLGEAYFAKKLLDYELSANNGNWQWAAGTGCDAAPYFRIFNPLEQFKKFDKNQDYVKKWVPEFGTDSYPEPIIEHKFARERALEAYKKGING
jgi:deoxyribodipyrimidine photo-lyase